MVTCSGRSRSETRRRLCVQTAIESAKETCMRSSIFAAMVLAAAPIGPASAADLVSPMVVSAPYETDCAGANALARVKRNFAWAERKQWHRGFVIERISNPRPSGHPYSEPGLVKRDYCVADSIMTDGSEHRVYYVIEHG